MRMYINNWKTQFRKGILEFVILSLLSDNPCHGYELAHRLEKGLLLSTFKRAKNIVRYQTRLRTQTKKRKISCTIRLRHIAGTQWGLRRYMNMDRLKELKRGRLAVLEGVAG